jgi:hypothetical protein
MCHCDVSLYTCMQRPIYDLGWITSITILIYYMKYIYSRMNWRRCAGNLRLCLRHLCNSYTWYNNTQRTPLDFLNQYRRLNIFLNNNYYSGMLSLELSRLSEIYQISVWKAVENEFHQLFLLAITYETIQITYWKTYARIKSKPWHNPPPPGIPPGIWILTFWSGQIPYIYLYSRSNTPRIVKNWSSNSPPHVRIGSYSIS